LWQFNPFISKMPHHFFFFFFFFFKKKKEKKKKKSKKYARVAEPPIGGGRPPPMGWFGHTQAGRLGAVEPPPVAHGWFGRPLGQTEI
jgi:hypothetical protein